MASQGINEFHRESPQPFVLRDGQPGPGWAPYRAAARALPHKKVVVPETCEEEGNCVKGLLVGIGLEGAAALGVYGIWQLCHLVR